MQTIKTEHHQEEQLVSVIFHMINNSDTKTEWTQTSPKQVYDPWNITKHDYLEATVSTEKNILPKISEENLVVLYIS